MKSLRNKFRHHRPPLSFTSTKQVISERFSSENVANLWKFVWNTLNTSTMNCCSSYLFLEAYNQQTHSKPLPPDPQPPLESLIKEFSRKKTNNKRELFKGKVRSIEIIFSLSLLLITQKQATDGEIKKFIFKFYADFPATRMAVMANYHFHFLCFCFPR